MKYRDLISGIFWLIVGLLLSVLSTRYQIGRITSPGSGFLPLAMGLLLIFFSLIILGRAKKSSLAEEAAKTAFSLGGRKSVVNTILILLLATFLFEKMGYLITVFFLMAFLMLVAKLRSWVKIFCIAFFTALGVYLVFVLLLQQPFPRGLLGI